MPKQPEDVVEDADKVIGENVQRFRTAKGLSQAQLAEALNVAQQTILKIEKGTRPLRYTEAAAIAQTLDIPLDALAPDRLIAQERAGIDSHSVRTREDLVAATRAITDYLVTALMLKTILAISPNIEMSYTATELELMRWMTEGEFFQALDAAMQGPLHTAPKQLQPELF